ncbi:MAG: hypothetical protein QOE83_945 [Actinomycetota bacterium]|jgi:hypothetical protein|nr:hypothetical protein [Actinomycetota bacterium]
MGLRWCKGGGIHRSGSFSWIEEASSTRIDARRTYLKLGSKHLRMPPATTSFQVWGWMPKENRTRGQPGPLPGKRKTA